MKGNSKVVAASIAIAVGVAFQQNAKAQTNIPRPTYKYEKCFGIVRADRMTASVRPIHAAGPRHGTTIQMPGFTCLQVPATK